MGYCTVILVTGETGQITAPVTWKQTPSTAIGDPQILEAISDDGPTVRKIRSWLR